MILLNDFYSVLETSITEAGFAITVELNPDHIVYAGHFPGHPITPGVIQTQIVHELLEKQFDRKLMLVEMPQCKFLKKLNPNETLQLVINIEYNWMDNLVSIKAWGESGANIFFKLNANYLQTYPIKDRAL